MTAAGLGAGQGLGVESKAVGDTGLWLPYPPPPPPHLPPQPFLEQMCCGGGADRKPAGAGMKMNKAHSDWVRVRTAQRRDSDGGGGSGMKVQRRVFPGDTAQAETGGLSGRKGKEW